MKYKMIALDLDGTLTNSQKTVSERNKEALKKAADMGVHVVLASGRPLVGIRPVAEMVGLSEIGGYMLAYNGAHIVDGVTGETIMETMIPEEYYQDIVKYGSMFEDVTILTYNHEGAVTLDDTNYYAVLEAKINRVKLQKVSDLCEALDGPVCKFLCVGEHDHLREIEKLLKEKYGDKLNVFFSETYFLEIVPPGIEKAASLRQLMKKFGIDRSELIACGDGMNDITMIDYAGLGVAMENAQDALRSRADYITDTNDNDGVAEVIEKFILEKE
ncbi:HAD-superfamily hydrolase, subfamily IIB [Lachnospiraceae bacterium JC7]|nr:HAD-superfamily hydrolase, subfamily IIB [Lachnospiraceae bacterium JC7]